MRLEEGTQDKKGLPAAVCLEIDPGHQGVAEEEGKHVIAVPPLRLRDVQLEAVAESEDLFRPGRRPNRWATRAMRRASAAESSTGRSISTPRRSLGCWGDLTSSLGGW